MNVQESYFVNISVYWSLKEFIEMYGEIEEVKLYHKKGNTGTFYMCIFKNCAGLTQASISRNVSAFNKEQLEKDMDNLMVGLQKEKEYFIIFNCNWTKRTPIVIANIEL